jgi:hypothetical protein
VNVSSRDKTAQIPREFPELNLRNDRGNPPEIPCFRLKHTFEFRSDV